MNLKLPVFILLSLLLLSGSSAFASQATDDAAKGKDITLVNTTDMRYHRTPVRKLFRGVANIGTCPLELPASMYNVAVDEESQFSGFALGACQGLFTALLRGMEGVFDTVTFIIPPYSKSIMTPEFSWDSLQQAHDAYDAKFSVLSK